MAERPRHTIPARAVIVGMAISLPLWALLTVVAYAIWSVS